jgi:hypothetical protein
MEDCTVVGITIPALNNDLCKGVTTSADCVINKLAITFLSLPANSTQTQVTNALLASLVDARQRIVNLEERVDNLENI